MKWHLFLALGGPARAIAGLQPFGEPQFNDGVVCYTYLSTYLVAIAAETAEPDFPSLPSFPTTRGIVPPFFSNRSTSIPPSVITEVSEINENPGTLIDFTTSDFAIPTEDQEDPGTTATDSGSLFLPTLVTSTATEASPTSSEPVSGQPVIFFVSPQVDNEKRDIFKRAPGGFIGDGNTNVDICTNAGTFRLGDGQLFDLQDPIYYDGESYKEFRSEGTPPEDAITREFSNVGGTLVFSNGALPNTDAGFCQDKGGQVYITFTSSPPGCVPISLRVYAVEQCQNGQIIGLDPAETATTDPIQPSSIVETMNSAFTETTTFPEDLSSTALSTAQLSQSTDPSFETTETTASLDLSESSPPSSADRATTMTSDVSPESTLSYLSSSSPSTETPLSFTTLIETSIASEQFTSLLSSFTTTASSDSFSSDIALSSDLLSSTDTVASEPTPTLTIELSTESELTPELSSTTTEEVTTTTTEETITTTTEEVTTTTTEEATTATTEEVTTTTTEETITTTTEEVTTTTTEEATTATTEEVTTTTTEETITTTTEEPTTTTGCNSVDPLTTVALVNPTPVFNDQYRDNEFASIQIPWDEGLLGTGQKTVYINTNGYITLDAGNTNPNNRELPTGSVVNRAFLPYWDDLVYDPSKGHAVVYEIFNTFYGILFVVEFILGKANGPGVYHFEVSFFRQYPDDFRFQYYTTPEKGSSATAGFQNLITGRYTQLSLNQADILFDGSAYFLTTAESGVFQSSFFDNTECGIGNERI